jgi:hypothetical protein
MGGERSPPRVATVTGRPSSPPWPVLVGGLAVGTLDITFAITFWRIGYGVAPTRVLQSVAAGLLGKASFAGGAPTAVLGGVLHFLIAMSMGLAYYAAGRRVTVLTRRPVAAGLAYGVLLYAFMNLVVLPLSAVGMPKFDNAAWVGLSIAFHALFGVIFALAARRHDLPSAA